MTSLQALALVTGREMRERAKSKAFIGSTIFSILILAAVIALPNLLDDGEVTYEIGTLGEGNATIVSVARSLADNFADEDDEVTFTVTEFASRADADVALEAGDVEVVLVDGSTLLRLGSGGFGGSDTDRLLQRSAASAALEDELAGTNVAPEDVSAIFTEQPLETATVSGEEGDLDDARSVIAYGGLMLMYFAVLSFGAWTLTGIAEEKSSRVVEVLLATLRPWQLLAGKILGIGVLGLAQFVVTVVVALITIRVTGVLDLPAIPIDSAVTLVVWFVLGYGLFSVMFGTAGALVSRMEDAQTAAFPISIIAVGGFFVSFLALEDPTGLIAQITTYIPFTAPFVVPLRVAFQAIAWWEYALAVGVSAATILGLVRFAGRVYSGGLLSFGRKLSFRQAYRAAEIG